MNHFRKNLVADERRLIICLAISAGVLLFAYFFYFFLVPLTPARMTRPTAELMQEWRVWSFFASLNLPFLQNAQIIAVLLILIAGVVFAVTGAAIYLTWNRPPARKSLNFLLASVFVFSIISTLALPNLNTDIYQYITRARVAAVHDSNPHYIPADAFPDDPVYPYASHNYTGIVGDKLAMWTLISIPLAKIAGDSPVVNLMVFRMAFLFFNIANVLLLIQILKRINPGNMLSGIILYAWNPIVVVMGQSKTDTVMVFFLFLAIFMLILNYKRLAVISFVSSAFVKLISFPLLALYFLQILRLKRWQEFLEGALIAAATIILMNLPFWDGEGMIQSHLELIRGESGVWLPESIRLVIFAATFLLMFALVWYQDGTHRRLFIAWAIIMMCISLLVLRISNAWYHMTFLAVVSVLLNWRIVAISLAITFASYLFSSWYTTFGGDFQVPDLFDLPRILVFAAPAGLVIFCITLVELLKKRGLLQKNPGPGQESPPNNPLKINRKVV